ncbi:MAG: DUF2155 domain-containing protein [Erythrobacter sp.]|nr:DUF2155 domain-containing protein [Erythrobacter sp.]
MRVVVIVQQLAHGLIAALCALVLAACAQSENDEQVADDIAFEAEPDELADQSSAPVAPSQAVRAALDEATPPEERVATIGLLNKRNNETVDLEIRPGESVEEGPVIVRLEACERTAPYEFPQDTGAFVQLDVRERGESDHRRVFSGWLFKENPSLNIVEHPIYDVWVKDCAMRFPGED